MENVYSATSSIWIFFQLLNYGKLSVKI